MSWVAFAIAAWVLCAIGLALIIGRSIRLADRRSMSEPLEVPDPLVRGRPGGPERGGTPTAARSAVVRLCVRPRERVPRRHVPRS